MVNLLIARCPNYHPSFTDLTFDGFVFVYADKCFVCFLLFKHSLVHYDLRTLSWKSCFFQIKPENTSSEFDFQYQSVLCLQPVPKYLSPTTVLFLPNDLHSVTYFSEC